MVRLRTLFRRLSARSEVNTDTTPSTTRSTTPPSRSSLPPAEPGYTKQGSRLLRKSSSLPKLRKSSIVSSEHQARPEVPETLTEQRESLYIDLDGINEKSGTPIETPSRRSENETVDIPVDDKDTEAATVESEQEVKEVESKPPVVVIEQATPDAEGGLNSSTLVVPPRSESGEVTLAPSEDSGNLVADEPERRRSQDTERSCPSPKTQASKPDRPTNWTLRKPSLLDSANVKVINTLIDAPTRKDVGLPTSDSLAFTASTDDVSGIRGLTKMLHRKVWVRRPGGSPTLVQIKEDDLVDDVRETILRKYANSLGRTFDAPDMCLYIITRAEQGQTRTQRVLGPEEEMCKTIDQYYPGGQTVDEALVIDTPQRRTPRPSPKVYHPSYQQGDEYRPLENGTDYFPPMPANIPATVAQTTTSNDSRSSHHHHPSVAGTADHARSISVLTTGQVPPLPSPGGTIRSRHPHRPKYGRQPTSSPTILSHSNVGAVVVNPPGGPHISHRSSIRPRLDSSASDAHHPNGTTAAPPLPTPPAPEAVAVTTANGSPPPTPSGGPPHMRSTRPKKTRKPESENKLSRRKKDSSSNTTSPHPNNISTMGVTVPPINVLIVEDNLINLRILQNVMERLKVRWQTAVNGQIAVDKWRKGGFHLVLMDIQMPVMTGLQATKEIRRLERVNGIGVFSSTSPDTEDGGKVGTNGTTEEGEEKKDKDADKLPGISEGLFKSPVIIVALTASSLQSDRHEALAAGCNDFLTKPVNFVWLERKVKEWGCMQALIDFDGWRKWKDFAEKAEAGKTEEERAKDAEKAEKDRVRAEKMAKLQEKQAKLKEEREKEKKEKEKGKRMSLNTADGLVGKDGAGGGSLKSGVEVLEGSGFEMG